MSGLVLDGVTLRLGGKRLIGPLDLAVRPGECASVMGASGSGKSSLLAFLCGTLDPAFAAEGRAALDGAPLDGLPPEKRRVGILFQDDLLFPHLSVGGNLAFAIPRAAKDRKERVAAALAEAELDGYEARDPATLSGGQRARVALMRALLAEPKAILLDEPFSKLDAGLRGRMREFVFAHIRARNIPCLLVTHDPEDAAAAGGAVVRL
ncbi:MAG: ATP-binding cassette domain-containing protein [Tagaea sp.]|nr:ATP-binding cassette domain-containing protein [Tagaea sp.]